MAALRARLPIVCLIAVAAPLAGASAFASAHRPAEVTQAPPPHPVVLAQASSRRGQRADFADCNSYAIVGAESIAACTRVIENDRTSKRDVAIAYQNRGYEWARQQDLDKALADFNRAIEMFPGYVIALINRAEAHLKKGYLDDAIADASNAIGRDGRNVKPYVTRSRAWTQKGELDRALAEADRAVRLNDDYAYAYVARGDAYRARGDRARAQADYDRAVRLGTDEDSMRPLAIGLRALAGGGAADAATQIRPPATAPGAVQAPATAPTSTSGLWAAGSADWVCELIGCVTR